jgi:inner membrane protein
VDTLTHALSGALIARASASRREHPDALPLARRVLVGFAAGAFPDIDFVAGYLGQLAYLYHHRGVTHSLLLLPLWAWALAHLCALAWRRDRPWRAYAGVIALAIGTHLAGDWITSFGTMLFAPFSDERYALSTTFIIDLWFTGIILAGLLLSLAWRRSRVPAACAAVVLAGYVGFQYVQQQQAVRLGERFAQAAGLAPAAVSALPRPVSPFNWMVVVAEPERYHYALVNLVREAPRAADAGAGFIARLDQHYLPPAQAVWTRAERYGEGPQAAFAREAYARPEFEFFRWFAEYPALLRVEAGNPSACAWFHDLRFYTPGRGQWPFRFGLCRDGAGQWRAYELDGASGRLPVR